MYLLLLHENKTHQYITVCGKNQRPGALGGLTSYPKRWIEERKWSFCRPGENTKQRFEEKKIKKRKIVPFLGTMGQRILDNNGTSKAKNFSYLLQQKETCFEINLNPNMMCTRFYTISLCNHTCGFLQLWSKEIQQFTVVTAKNSRCFIGPFLQSLFHHIAYLVCKFKQISFSLLYN